MWFIYESTTRTQAAMNPDSYAVPAFCDAKTAAPFKGVNAYNQNVKFIAAQVDETKIDEMPDHIRADFDVAAAENRNQGDFVLNPHKLRPVL